MRNQRILAFLLVLTVAVSWSIPAMASEVETESAATMQLTRTTGTVTVTKSSEKPVSVREGMRLYDGYNVETDAESYAWINLDSSKLIKLDASSQIEIRKNGRLLEVNVSSGSAFFDVSKKLDSSENLNVRTSTMAVGIRGTSGWVSRASQLETQVCLLEGACACAVSDPVTRQTKDGELHGGETASCVVYEQGRAGDKCDIIMGTASVETIPGFVLTDLVENVPLCDAIRDSSGLNILADLAALAGGNPDGLSENGTVSPEVLALAANKLSEAEQANAIRLQQMQSAEMRLESSISRDNVWNSGSVQASLSSTGPQQERAAVQSVSPVPSASVNRPVPSAQPAGTPAQAAPTSAAPVPSVSQPVGVSTSPVSVPPSQAPEPSTAASPAATSSAVPTGTIAQTPGASATQSSAQTPTSSVAPSNSMTPGMTPAASPTPGTSPQPSASPSAEATQSSSAAASGSTSVEPDQSPSPQPTRTATPTGSDDPEGSSPEGSTASASPAQTPSSEHTPTAVPTSSPVPPTESTSTLEPTTTPVPTLASPPTPVPTPEPTPTPTPVPTPEPTPVPTPRPTYTVTFDANGGTVNGATTWSADTNEDGHLSDLGGLPTPTRQADNGSTGDYTFDGWYTAEIGGTEIGASSAFTSNTTVYAHWKGWSRNGGVLTIFGAGDMANYGSGGAPWGNDVETAVLENGVTSIGENAFYGCGGLTNVTIPNSVSQIGFAAFSGCSSLTSVSIPSSVTNIESGTFHGCSSLETVSVPGNVTSIGANAFSGCINLQNITIPTSVSSIGQDAFSDCLVVHYAGTRAEWDSITGSGTSGIADGRLLCLGDLFAKARRSSALSRSSALKCASYVITFDAAGGTQEAESCSTDASGRVSELPEPIREGYVFDGWYTAKTGGEYVDAVTVFDCDTTIYAHWKEAASRQGGAPFTIRLDGCEGILKETTVRTDDSGRLMNLPKPVRDGFAFTGWYTARTGGEKINSGAVFSEDTTLYAHWKAEDPALATASEAQYTIRFNACGGSVTSESAKTKDDGRLSSLPTPVREEYVFAGWYTARTGGNAVSTSTVFDIDTTLYARWKDGMQGDEAVFTVQFDACGGSVETDSMRTNKEGRLGSLPAPTWKNHTFLGWYTKTEGGRRVSTNTVFDGPMKLYARWQEIEPVCDSAADRDDDDSSVDDGSPAEADSASAERAATEAARSLEGSDGR